MQNYTRTGSNPKDTQKINHKVYATPDLLLRALVKYFQQLKRNFAPPLGHVISSM